MENSKKVYIISTGSYSDWSIAGIFSNEADAEEINALIPDHNTVEEWELDEIKPADFRGRKPYYVRMDANGNVTSIESERECRPSSAAYYESWRPVEGIPLNNAYCDCWASSEEHAIKIANEKRAEYIASGMRDRQISAIRERLASDDYKIGKILF